MTEQIFGWILLAIVIIVAIGWGIGIYFYNKIEKSIVEIMKELDEDSDCLHKDSKIDVTWRENENIKAIVECKDCNKKIEKELFKKEDKK